MTGKGFLRALVAFVLIWTIQVQANAQTAATYTGFGQMMNNIISSTPGLNGVSVSGTADGVTLRTTGNIAAEASAAIRIPVMATTEALVSKAALISAAGKLVAGANVIGAAYTGYEVYNWVKGQGITTCAPPNFFCKPGTPAQDYAAPGDYWHWTSAMGNPAYGDGTPEGVCSKLAALYGYNAAPYSYGTNLEDSLNSSCWQMRPDVNSGARTIFAHETKQSTGNCPAGTTMNALGRCQGGATDPTPFGAPQDFIDAVSGTNWDPARGKALMDAIVKDNARQKLLTQTDVVPLSSPVTLSAPPATSPQTVTKVETIANPDGSTSTKTTSATTTVTPTVSGTGTLASPPTVTYPSVTTTTTTTVNNTTNASTTNTTVDNTTAKTDADKPALCKLFPNIVACQELGTAPDAEKIVPVDATPTMTNVPFASAASCPAPITYNMGRFGTGSIPFTTLCDWLALIRPLFLAIGACAVAFIFMKGVQTA